MCNLYITQLSMCSLHCFNLIKSSEFVSSSYSACNSGNYFRGSVGGGRVWLMGVGGEIEVEVVNRDQVIRLLPGV